MTSHQPTWRETGMSGIMAAGYAVWRHDGASSRESMKARQQTCSNA